MKVAIKGEGKRRKRKEMWGESAVDQKLGEASRKYGHGLPKAVRIQTLMQNQFKIHKRSLTLFMFIAAFPVGKRCNMSFQNGAKVQIWETVGQRYESLLLRKFWKFLSSFFLLRFKPLSMAYTKAGTRAVGGI